MRFEGEDIPDKRTRYVETFCWLPRTTKDGTTVWLEPVVEMQRYYIHGSHPDLAGGSVIRATTHGCSAHGWMSEGYLLPENAPGEVDS